VAFWSWCPPTHLARPKVGVLGDVEQDCDRAGWNPGRGRQHDSIAHSRDLPTSPGLRRQREVDKVLAAPPGPDPGLLEWCSCAFQDRHRTVESIDADDLGVGVGHCVC
jgi:hypothetical protein